MKARIPNDRWLIVLQFVALHPFLTAGQLAICLRVDSAYTKNVVSQAKREGLLLALHLPGEAAPRYSVSREALRWVSLPDGTDTTTYLRYLGRFGTGAERPAVLGPGRAWEHDLSTISWVVRCFARAEEHDLRIDWLAPPFTRLAAVKGTTRQSFDAVLELRSRESAWTWGVEWSQGTRHVPSQARQLLGYLLGVSSGELSVDGILVVAASRKALEIATRAYRSVSSDRLRAVPLLLGLAEQHDPLSRGYRDGNGRVTSALARGREAGPFTWRAHQTGFLPCWRMGACRQRPNCGKHCRRGSWTALFPLPHEASHWYI